MGKNNNKSVKYVLTVAVLLVLWGMYCFESFADVSYADLFLAGRGYKPVEDSLPVKPLITYPTDLPVRVAGMQTGGSNITDNQLYREWCIKTFKNGEQIYEAYKEIAFEINYRAEPSKTDYWQTPVETRQTKQGDCEDSVFLFFSKLSGLDIDGDIIWGWVADKENSIAFAHVWYQLSDKRGRPYIVEGFSKEWNGIKPVEMLTEGERRVPVLMLRHNQVNRVVDEMMPRFTESFEEDQFTWAVYMNNATMVKEIFQKLQVMFARYKGQLHQSMY
ncbi:MAG: hypothetical protein NUV74_13800 [Candidatus Brocadiaceae bacterium]|nr:hypothetical protein [Candidatus Brocadiaceae bacterium]